MPETFCPVSIVEDVGLGEVLGEAPFAETCDLIALEEASTVAKRSPLDVMKSYGDGVSEKRGAFGGARLEGSGGNGRDLFDSLEKVCVRIEGNGASKWLKGGTIGCSTSSPDFV
jgi:hypothetical protein